MKLRKQPQDGMNAALERAALLGREFPLALLRASGIADAAIDGLFDDATLIAGKQPARARFAKANVPRKIAAAIPWSRARDHHLALGEAAKQQRLPAAEIAAHFEAAHRFDLARSEWLKAGEAACAESRYREALAAIDRALAIWPWDEQADDRVRVLREMARCAANARMPDHAAKAWEELADHARDTGSHPLLAEALHQLAGLSSDAVKTGSMLAEAAAIAARELPPAEAFRHGRNHVDHLANRVRVAAAREVLVEVEKAAVESRDPALISEMLGWKGLLTAMAGNSVEASRWVEDSLKMAIDHELPEQVAVAYKRRANIADYAGEYQAERQAHDVAIRYCQKVGNGSEIVCMSCLSYACFRTGDWKDALDTVREVLSQPDLHRGLKAIASGVRGFIATFRGERGPALKHLEESLRLERAEGMVGMEFLSLWALGFWHSSNGDAESASATYDEIRTLWRDSDDLHDAIPGLLFAGAHYADLGKSPQLADCIDILGRIEGHNNLPECRAALLALKAEQARLEGNHDEAERSLSEASLLEAKAGLPLERLWIECRRQSGDRSDAIALATRLGARPFLARLKGDPGSDLTPRQAEVLSFLAGGLTSKEIADRLNLSTRTVEMHVGRLLQRLGCRTRPEAVALAQSRGWLKLP